MLIIRVLILPMLMKKSEFKKTNEEEENNNNNNKQYCKGYQEIRIKISVLKNFHVKIGYRPIFIQQSDLQIFGIFN